MFRRLRIAPKLALSALGFVAPTVFGLYLLIGAQNLQIDFAAQEVAGVRYLEGLAKLQASVLQAALLQGGAAGQPDWPNQIRRLEAASAGVLDTRAAAEAAASALAPGQDLVTGRARLRDLITRIGDRSNLILDNVLESYYMTDAVLNRLPDLQDRLSDMAGLAGHRSVDAKEQARFLVGLGGLTEVLEGLSGSVASAFANNADGSLKASLDRPWTELHGRITGFIAKLESDGPQLDVRDLLGIAAEFNAQANAQLELLLTQRVAGAHFDQWRDITLTLLLFCIATATVLLAARRWVVTPLSQLTRATVALSAGGIETVIPVMDGQDELSDLSRALLVFQGALAHNRALEAGVAREAEHRRNRQETLESLARDFNVSVSGQLETVARAAQGLHETASTLALQAQRTSARSSDVQGSASQARENAGIVAAAAEQLAASCKEIAGQIERSSLATRGLVAHAEQARALVRELTEVVVGTGQVVELINSVAGQTHLLALNANIEASRAGEAGRGFAVVAKEVKLLASQTSRATSDITTRIEAVHRSASDAASIIHQIADLVQSVDQTSGAIASAVTQQVAATEEISRNITEAAQSTGVVSDGMAVVRADARAAGVVSDTLKSAATDLSQQSQQLHEDVGLFLKSMAQTGDRRQSQRHVLSQSLRVQLNHQPMATTTLINISESGAALRWDQPARCGDPITLADLTPSGLGGRVVAWADGVLRLQFQFDDATQADVRRFIASRFAEAA